MSEPRHTADAFAAFEQAGWKPGALRLTTTGWARRPRGDPALLDAARVTRGSAVLDVATGPGYAAALAAERGAAVVAVDLSHEMLELAASLHPEVEFRHAGANAPPFEDATFDAVASNLLMPARGRPPRRRERAGPAAARRWARGADHMGSRASDVPQRDAGDAPRRRGGATARDPVGPSFFQYATDDEFASLLAGAGLTDPAVETIRLTHSITDAGTFVDDMAAGTVRMGVLIASQPAEVRAAIRSGFEERVERWRTGSGYELRCSFKLGAGELLA